MRLSHSDRIVALILSAGALLTLSGCASNRTQWDAPATKDPVLVFATIDVTDARWPDGFKMERLKPEPGVVTKNSWRYKFKDKKEYVILNEQLSVGEYRMNSLDVDAGTIVRFDTKDDPRFHRTFSKPGVYFLGAYKFHVVYPPHMIGKMKIELQSVQGPGEREAIERLLAAEQLKDDYWREQLTKRLKQLSR